MEDLSLFNRQDLELEAQTLLENLRPPLDVIDFVVVRQALKKIIDEALADSEEFERAILSGEDSFVVDVSNNDPLAFIMRGAMHIEQRIIKILDELNIILRSRSTFNDRIEALKTQTRYPADSIPVLHAIRKLRNTPAHDLESGRTVDRVAADELYREVEASRRSDLAEMVGHDPLELAPDMLVKLVFNTAYRDVESFLRQHRWQSTILKAMRLQP
jgi:hypothetical protein